MSHLSFSPVIAGCMKWGQWGVRFTTAEYQKIIAEAISYGITTFDHADIYGHYTTEEEFGAALQQMKGLRKRLQLVTKCGIKMISANRPAHLIKSYDLSARHIRQSVETSLRNLHTDYLDLLLLHRPDPLFDADEIAEVFTQLKQEGKVIQFGVSNFTVSQMSLLHSQFPVSANQVELSILQLQPFLDGTLDFCQQHKITVMAWSPLGGGNLFGDVTNERSQRIVAVAAMLAEKYKAAPDQILLAWLLQHPNNILPVTGTSKAARLKAAIEATSIKMEREEWFMLWRASTGTEVP